MKPINIILKSLYLICCLLFLNSCATETEQREQLEQPTTGQSVVFGHVDVIVDGKVQEWGFSWTGDRSCCLMILPPDSSLATTYKINDDGMFYISLNPGEYQLLGFRFQKDTAWKVGRIDGTFNVPDEQEATYIGNITIQMVQGRHVTIVKDDSKEPINKYKTKFPQRSGQVTTSLLQLPDAIGNFEHILHECNNIWGVDCSDNFSGVTPLSPEVTTQSQMFGEQAFPETDSLMPKFSWKSAEKSGISYDLIIYEAATYSLTGRDEHTMKGRVVLYEENLSSSSYQLKTPLKEKTKYYWSVRLRDQDTISRWSTFSHFGFYVFYMTSGYGQWFAFSTP
jgi:hypothetical protein